MEKALRPEFAGGTLTGITHKLDYLKQLGINTIWISPFYQNNAYHGYHITNFDAVDKRFGNKNDIIKLIKGCKERNLRIIADIVPNHCFVQHPFFKSAISNINSEYSNWFYLNQDRSRYLSFLDFQEIPKLNLENAETADYMVQSICNWARLGFDGFRIDHVLGVPDNFLLNLKSQLRKIKPDFVLIGEAWGEGTRAKNLKTLKFKGKHKLWKQGFKQIDLQKHYMGLIDGVLDFGWRNLLFENIDLIKQSPENFITLSRSYTKNYNSDFYLPRFLDNHDTSRLMHECKNDEELYKAMLKILIFQDQPLILYYGTESGLSHQPDVDNHIPFSDLYARGFIDWALGEPKYYNYIRELIEQRIKYR